MYNFIIFVILGLGGFGVKKKFRKKGFFGGPKWGVPRVGGHNSFNSTRNGIFSRIQGVFSTGESIGSGFEAKKNFF